MSHRQLGPKGIIKANVLFATNTDALDINIVIQQIIISPLFRTETQSFVHLIQTSLKINEHCPQYIVHVYSTIEQS